MAIYFTRLGFGREDLQTAKDVVGLVVFPLSQVFAGDVILSGNLRRAELEVVDSAGGRVDPTIWTKLKAIINTLSADVRLEHLVTIVIFSYPPHKPPSTALREETHTQ